MELKRRPRWKRILRGPITWWAHLRIGAGRIPFRVRVRVATLLTPSTFRRV